MNHLDVFYQMLEIFGLPLPKNVDPADRCKWQNVFNATEKMTYAKPIFDFINMNPVDIRQFTNSVRESIKKEWNLP